MPFCQWCIHPVSESIQLQHLREHALCGPAHWHWLLLRDRLRHEHGHRRPLRLDLATSLLHTVPPIREQKLWNLHRKVRQIKVPFFCI